MFSRTGFISILEKATSHLQLEPDWNAIIAVSDSIRQGDVEPKFALNSIKKKLTGPNLHVNMFALLVLESCVKNCGPSFHAEIATKSFMEELHEIVKGSTNEKVKEKILELVQAWAHAFRNQASYRPVQDMCNLLKLEGYKFPVLKESDAMFSASVAPEWVDGDCCNRCRVTFNILERKHHCRHCGQVFCNKCSSRQSILPKFGIEKEVRVCEDCYEKLNTTTVLKPATKSDKNNSTNSGSTSSSNNNNSSSTAPPTKTEEELREEEELQMAIALSKSEAEIKEKQQKAYSNNYQTAFTSFENESIKETIINKQSQEQLDPNLNLYMNRAYWEQKSKERENVKQRTTDNAQPSAPQQTLVKNKQQIINQNDQFDKSNIKTTTALFKNETAKDIEQFQNNLKSTIEIFVNRMNSNKNRGRPISNDSAVQSMFLNITNMHSQLLKHIQQQDDLRSKFELLQDKLNQARDARAALDSLREEHNERLRREAEEAEMIRQQQMAFKLDIMKKKKQEYLQYQRQIALQRVQDQEREMKMRLEQQKYAAWPSPTQSTTNQQQLPSQPINQYNAMPVYPVAQSQIPQSNYGPINYGDQTGIYNPPVNQYTPTNQPGGNLHNHNLNIHHSMHQQVLTQHMPQPQHQQLPVHQVTTISNSDYPQSYQLQPQGVYNMQPLNNNLPSSNTNLNNQTQQQPQTQYLNQASIHENNQTISNENSLSINKKVEEEPLISFD